MEIDIFNIDKKIRDMWLKKQEDIKELEGEINFLNSIIDDDDDKKLLSIHVQRDIKEKINNLTNLKNRIQEDIQNIDFYTIDFAEMIENNKSLVPKKISFMGKSQNCKEEVNNISKLFLDILKKYNIECKELENLVTKVKKKEKKICSCGDQNFVLYFDQNVEICENCGKQEEKSFKSISYKDISRINMSSKYTYERRIHFKDCMNQYQGKQNATIDDVVYTKLEEEFERHGLLSQGDKKNRFQNITKDHILLFLKETGYSKHYEDVVLIYHKMTGKPVDDISYLENKLMEDFDKISNLYDKKYKFTGKIDRKSFINTQYILFQLLRRHKYNCKKEDFNMLKTLDRKSFHDEIVKDLFETLNFNFTPIF